MIKQPDTSDIRQQLITTIEDRFVHTLEVRPAEDIPACADDLAKLFESVMLSVIGDDEIVEPDYYEFTPKEIIDNELRAIQRTRLNELLGKKTGDK